MQHDVSKVLLLLHRILTHLKDPHISLTDNPDLEEFSVVLEQIQTMLPRAMHGGVDGSQALVQRTTGELCICYLCYQTYS